MQHPLLIQYAFPCTRPVSLRGIFDNLDAVSSSQIKNGIHICRLTVEVDRYDRLGARCDLFLDPFNIDIVCARVDIDEDHPCPYAGDGLRCCHEAVGNGDHLVSRADPEGF